MRLSHLRHFGFRVFYKPYEIIEILRENNIEEVFDEKKYFLFVKKSNLRIWLFTSKDNLYFLSDTGVIFKTIIKIPKSEMYFNVQENIQYCKFIFNTGEEVLFDTMITSKPVYLIQGIKNMIS